MVEFLLLLGKWFQATEPTNIHFGSVRVRTGLAYTTLTGKVVLHLTEVTLLFAANEM